MTATRRISKIIKDWVEYNIVWWWSEAVDTCLDTTSENPVQNKVIAQAINTKQDTLTAWPNTCIYTEDNTLKICATDTTYSNATQSSDWLMSASDKKKLDWIAIHKIRYVIVWAWGWWGWFRWWWWGWGEIKIWSVWGFNNKYNITIWAAWVWWCACGNCQFSQATWWWNTSLQNDFSGETITAKWWCWWCNWYWDSSYSCYRWWAWWASWSWCAWGAWSFNIAGWWWGATWAGCNYCSSNVSVWWLWICWFWGWWEPSASCSWWRCWWWKGGINYQAWWNATNYWGWWGGWWHCNAAIIWWNGCQWVVDICYPTDWSWYFTCATWWTKTTVTEWWVTYYRHRFTSNGTFTITG